MDQKVVDTYMENRLDDQLKYFEVNAVRNQRSYRILKMTGIACNVFTTMSIALAFTVPEEYKIWMGIVSLVLSTVVLGTYQLEEFQNYGAKWEKFRLVAEQLKSEKFLYLNKSGIYSTENEEINHKEFVERVEGTIRGTDIAYFSLMVDPGRRIEKRLQQADRH